MWKKGLFLALTAGAIVFALLGPPAHLPDGYHDFADARAWAGIPNAANVLTNLAFLAVGVWGLAIAGKRATLVDDRERPPWVVLFAGVLLTSAGSAWYHLAPDDARLVWDRLPMTLGFMGLFAALVAGLASVLFWRWTTNEAPYRLVQYYPLVAILLLLAIFPARYTRGGDLLVALALYVAAKLVELWDRPIFNALGFVSGHTLKHLLAAVAVAWLAAMILRRRPAGVRA